MGIQGRAHGGRVYSNVQSPEVPRGKVAKGKGKQEGFLIVEEPEEEYFTPYPWRRK